MAAKRKGLGRGLDALLGGATGASASEAIANVASDSQSQDNDGKLIKLPVERIQRGRYQPRRDMHPEALEELSESIKAQGVMQPIVVRPIGRDDSGAERYEIIAGERRWRATQLAELDTIPCLVRDVPDEAAIAMALIENIQREDLNPMEEAFALKRLQDEFELTQLEVAQAVGKSRTTITNLLRLLALTDDVKTLLERGDLEMGHARAILSLDASEQRDIARQVVAKGLSVRQTEALVRKLQQSTTETVATQQASADVQLLEESLSEKVGVPVSISYNAKGKGKLVLAYNSLDELDGILHHLGYKN